MSRTLILAALLAACLIPFAACNKETAQAFDDRAAAPLSDPLSAYSHVRITTSMGQITVALHWDAAPRTCLNFAKLAEKKFYDGIVFHRVIPDFMVQTGDPQGNGSGGPGYKFEDEIDADALGLDKVQAASAQYYMRDMQAAFMKRANAMGVTSQEQANARQDEMKKLQEEIMAMSVKRVLQEAGYTFTKGLPSKKAQRGSLAMANAGPDTNGSQFFINVADTPHLDGKHTVFGTVVAGMDIVDAISKVERGEQDRPKREVKIVSLTLLSNL